MTSAACDKAKAMTRGIISVCLPKNNTPIDVICSWRWGVATSISDTVEYFQSLDIVLRKLQVLPKEKEAYDVSNDNHFSVATPSPLGTLVCECSNVWTTAPDAEVSVKAILVAQSGYLCRNDILRLRFQHSQFVDSIIEFRNLDGHYPAVPTSGANSLPVLLSSSPGALVLQQPSDSQYNLTTALGYELRNRLSFDWILSSKPITRQVALVGGRYLYDWSRNSYGAKGPFDAALGLNISLVVLDQPGHWLEGNEYAHLRDDFIAIDTSNDASLPEIIARALRDRHIDGIVTFSDEFVIATAKAAELLRLRTVPVTATVQAHHKDETRRILNTDSIQVLRLSNAQQIDDLSLNKSLISMHYPLVVKPCRGGGSRGVKRVRDYWGMREAVIRIGEYGLDKHGILLETYIDGPEVDANFMLWDGELLFAEISDDFPCLADSTEATVDDDFVETLMVLPSGLPPRELDILRTSLHQDLLKLGFRTGVFHVEGRVRNSSMRYDDIGGILDLNDNDQASPDEPESFLIEANIRPPGLDCVFSTTDTYGVDMSALHFLSAIGDQERFAALCKPFVDGAQYWCGNSQVPVHRNNIRVPENFIDQVLELLPGVTPYVTRAELFTQPGAVISPKLGVGFIAYFLLISRSSRSHVLEMSLRIREVSKHVLDRS